jgi:hypothetical protein
MEARPAEGANACDPPVKPPSLLVHDIFLFLLMVAPLVMDMSYMYEGFLVNFWDLFVKQN